MLLYNIESFTIRMVRQSQRKSQRQRQQQRKSQQQRKTQRRTRKQQQSGGMTGVLNTALVPFGLLALQKFQHKRVSKKGKKGTKKRGRKSKKN